MKKLIILIGVLALLVFGVAVYIGTPKARVEPLGTSRQTVEVSEVTVASGHKGVSEFVRKRGYPETVQMPVRSEAYVVKNSDTWANVAEEHGLSLNLLAAANPELSLWKQPEVGETLRIPSPEKGLEDLQAIVEFQIIRDSLEWEEAARIAEAGEKAVKILGETNVFEGQELVIRAIKVGVADEEELERWKEMYGDDRPWGVAYLDLGLIYLHPNFLSPDNFDLLTYTLSHESGHLLTQTCHEDYDYPDGWKDDLAVRAGNAISHYLFPFDRFAKQGFWGGASRAQTGTTKRKP